MRYSWVLQQQPQQLSRMRVLRKGCSVLGYLVWVSSFSPWVVVSCRLVQKKQTGHFGRSWLMSMSSRCSWIKGSISWTSMIDWPTTIMLQTHVYMFGKNQKKIQQKLLMEPIQKLVQFGPGFSLGRRTSLRGDVFRHGGEGFFSKIDLLVKGCKVLITTFVFKKTRCDHQPLIFE